MNDLKMEEIDFELIELAKSARKKSYSPYSKFAVGAAVLDGEKGMFSGANVENSSYGLTVCAERISIFKAVTEGCRNLKKIAVVADVEDFVSPCGACRQVIFEFGQNIEVIMSNLKGNNKKMFIKDLLPYGFKL